MLKEIAPGVYFYFGEGKWLETCSNIYWLSKEKVLIDSGNGSVDIIKDLHLKPEFVFLTHGHFDHTLGAKKEMNTFMQPKDVELLGTFPFNNISPKAKAFDEIQKELEKMKIDVIWTPGHSPGSCCFLYKNLLLAGDTVFAGGFVGRTDIPFGSQKDLQDSLDKIVQLKWDLLCPGHGDIEKRRDYK